MRLKGEHTKLTSSKQGKTDTNELAVQNHYVRHNEPFAFQTDRQTDTHTLSLNREIF